MSVPSWKVPDSTVGFLREGYMFIGSRCDRLGTDSFHMRNAGRIIEGIGEGSLHVPEESPAASARAPGFCCQKSGFILQAPCYRRSSA